ncbi:MAG: TIGR01777 family oxidoreductase [Isosphaeraceae bacterium]
MRVFVTGGTGLIGRSLVRRLLERGDAPVVLSRQADTVRREPAMRQVQFVQGDPSLAGGWESALEGCEGVVNLVGHNIFADRWSSSVKRKIRDSRVYSTQHVVSAIKGARSRPGVLVQASAIGDYGPHEDETITEESHSGSDFMAVVCREWEEAAGAVEELGVRLATIRTGIVLAKGEGALGTITPLYRWLPGGAAPVGSGGNHFKPATGPQWMSWVHLDDIVGIFLKALDDSQARGPINGTSPNPVRHREFGQLLAKVLWRPFLPVGPPDAMLEFLLGEVAQVITKGQKVRPEALQKLGYSFQYPTLLPALEAIFGAHHDASTRTEAPVAHGVHG